MILSMYEKKEDALPPVYKKVFSIRKNKEVTLIRYLKERPGYGFCCCIEEVYSIVNGERVYSYPTAYFSEPVNDLIECK